MEMLDFKTMLETPIEPVLFNRKYGKDFLLLSQIDEFDKGALKVLCAIMEQLQKKYVKCGCLVFVPYADMKKVKHFIEGEDLSHVMFVEPIQENMLPIYKGARLYVNTLPKDTLCASALYALNLGIPVVTTETQYIKKIFFGTGFEQYVLDQDNVDGFCEKISFLFEKGFAYNDYKLNTPTIINNFYEEVNESPK